MGSPSLIWRRLADLLARNWPSNHSNLALVGGFNPKTASGSGNLDEIWDGMLWNTPKQRKNIKRKYRERYGEPFKWGNGRFIRENRKIRVDHATGHHFELGKLSQFTYNQVMEETKSIQDAILEAFGRFQPKDKEVRIIYENETAKKDDNVMPVEIPKPRPVFFSPNLVQKTRVPSDSETNTTVRPSGPLG